MNPRSDRDEIPQGLLDLLILRTLLREKELHGFEIAQMIERISEDVLQVEEGSLYPALYRMERDGWIEAEWGTSELGRKAKFYRLTAKGKRQLRAETEEFASFLAAVSPILLPA